MKSFLLLSLSILNSYQHIAGHSHPAPHGSAFDGAHTCEDIFDGNHVHVVNSSLVFPSNQSYDYLWSFSYLELMGIANLDMEFEYLSDSTFIMNLEGNLDGVYESFSNYLEIDPDNTTGTDEQRDEHDWCCVKIHDGDLLQRLISLQAPSECSACGVVVSSCAFCEVSVCFKEIDPHYEDTSAPLIIFSITLDYQFECDPDVRQSVCMVEGAGYLVATP